MDLANKQLIYSPVTDYVNPSIKGSIIFKDYETNTVRNIPVIDKNMDLSAHLELGYSDERYDCFKTIVIDHSVDDDGYESTLYLDDILATDIAGIGYEKLEQAIQEEREVTLDIEDFQSLGDSPSINFLSLAESILETDTPHFFEERIKDLTTTEINEEKFNIYYSLSNQHIFINEIPLLQVEFNRIFLLDERLGEVNFFEYEDAKEDNLIEIHLDDYKNENGLSIQNLIDDISVDDLIVDVYKMRIIAGYEKGMIVAYNHFIDEISEESAKVNKYMSNRHTDINTYNKHPYIVNSFIDDYERKRDLLIASGFNRYQFNNYEEAYPRELGKGDLVINNILNNFKNEIRQSDNFIKGDVFNRVNKFLNEFIDKSHNDLMQHRENKDMISGHNRLALLDKIQYENRIGKVSDDFYNAFQFATKFNDLSVDYKDRAERNDLIGDFKDLVEEEHNMSVDLDFYNQKVILNGKKEVDFDTFNGQNFMIINDILEGLDSLEKGNSIIKNKDNGIDL